MLDKTKVNQKSLNVFEAFAGIGAQHKAIRNIKSKILKVVGTSEWDARAIIAYAQIHHKNEFIKKLEEIKKWGEEKINAYLLAKTFSLNSKVPGRVVSKPFEFKINLVAANEVNKNHPDITKIKGSDLKGVNLLTYSFPCQGLSIANMGRDLGIKEDSKSTSNLIWQIKRLLMEMVEEKIPLPKYLLMENVKNLLSRKHKPDYERWLSFLESLGYKTNTLILNGFNHGSLQKRERVFGISIMDNRSYKSDDEFQKWFDKNFKNTNDGRKRERIYKQIMNSSQLFYDELDDATPKDTKSRRIMAKNNPDLNNRIWAKGSEWTFNTLTTKQDRNPNLGMVETKSKEGFLSKRFITPREAYQIMGFTSEDFSLVKEKYKEGLITKEALYRQAGNSIVVSVLEDIFRFIERYEGGYEN